MTKYLTPTQFNTLLRCTALSRYPQRDYLLLLLAYRHGLRVSELISIQLGDLNLTDNFIFIRRIKNGLSTNHPLQSDELLAISKYLSTRPDSPHSHLFLSQTNGPLTRFAVTNILLTISKKTGIQVHPHMLRHSCGYYLANNSVDLRLIQDYLGHRSIQSTVRYTAVNHARFQSLFQSIANDPTYS